MAGGYGGDIVFTQGRCNVVNGGAGDDVLNGGPGYDVCRGEYTTRCP